MYSEKVSISLPTVLMQFIEEYKKSHACKSRSQVIETAITLLRQQELASLYRQASAEADHLFDTTNSDGLSNETW